MKYNRHGEDLSCNGYYQNNVLQKVVCFSENRDTVLIEFYKDGIREGKSISSYENGIIKEIGGFSRGMQNGIWKEFHENGILKSYRFFKIENDTSFLIYEKLYNKNSELYTLRFPLSFRTNSDSDTFEVGQTYQLFVDLKYSEFDTTHSYGFIESAPLSSVKADTVTFEGKSIYLEFTPTEKGTHEIMGTFIEIDASKHNPEDGYGGEKKWTFKYEAKR
ncbi:MAG: hypothetical protein AAGA77_17170 [Bacteroidota bacterium]